MEFLKKFFTQKKKEDEQKSDEATFTCENCGEVRKESQKKAHMGEHAGSEAKNVCEFC